MVYVAREDSRGATRTGLAALLSILLSLPWLMPSLRRDLLLRMCLSHSPLAASSLVFSQNSPPASRDHPRLSGWPLWPNKSLVLSSSRKGFGWDHQSEHESGERQVQWPLKLQNLQGPPETGRLRNEFWDCLVE